MYVYTDYHLMTVDVVSDRSLVAGLKTRDRGMTRCPAFRDDETKQGKLSRAYTVGFQ